LTANPRQQSDAYPEARKANVSGENRRRCRCRALGPAGSRNEGDRKRASDTAELAFKVVQGEQQRGGAAVWTVMGMVGATALADEGGDLLGREPAAGLHRCCSRSPAASRSTFETSGVFLGPSRGSVFRLLASSRGATLCVSGAEV
jgi:hypothetical protein